MFAFINTGVQYVWNKRGRTVHLEIDDVNVSQVRPMLLLALWWWCVVREVSSSWGI